MDLYLDDCADSERLVRELASAGHHVVSPRDCGMQGVRDAEHLRYAAEHRHVLITRNPTDFRTLHQLYMQEGRQHAGILLLYLDNVRGKDMTPADIARAIGNLLLSGVPVENEVHILNHWR